MKRLKRLTAVLLAAMLALGLALPAQAKTAPPQGPGGVAWELDDEHPAIIVHGIGQSEVFLCEEDNVTKVIGSDGEPVQGWPPKIDVNGLIPKLIFPLLGSLLLQNDIFLTKTLRGVIKDVLNVFAMDLEGRPAQNMQVDRWHRYGGGDPTSLGDLKTAAPEQRRAALNHIPLDAMGELLGEDMMYYFAYDSFGNLEDTTDELYQLIQDLLAKHGADKVNIIPISLGGTVMNSLVERYRDPAKSGKPKSIVDQLNNVVYVVAALDGSNLVGDLFTRRMATGNESLYRTMIPGLVDGYLGYLLNIVLRLLPKRLVMSMVDALIDGVVGDVVSRSTMIWALLPQAYYDAAAKEWLDGKPEMADIKRQVAEYHTAQVNARDNILDMQARGVRCYAIVDYNFPMYNFVASAKDVNSDGLLQIDSPSLGAYSLGVDVPLPADYEANHPGCVLDAGRVVDASRGRLPNHTWYFKDQDHERTGRNDVVMRLVMRLAGGKQAQDVTSMPEWPQFNYGRDGRWLASNVDRYKDFDPDAIADAADRAEFAAAYAELKRQAEATVVIPGETEAIQERFSGIMVKIGEWNAPQQPDFWEQAGEKAAWFLSEALYFGYGARGFIDPIWRIWWD
jgi:pimeloyl-ACP methyl ester carboxylesterase